MHGQTNIKLAVVNDELQEMWNYKTTELVRIIHVPAKIRSQDLPTHKENAFETISLCYWTYTK